VKYCPLPLPAKDNIKMLAQKITHLAPNTTSQIISKSISKDGGRASYRGLLKIVEGAAQLQE
jgi:Fe-S cluster assembly protein SufB